jgi:ABC-type dipeptide/oligopeptide/nickel transport system permease subunit
MSQAQSQTQRLSLAEGQRRPPATPGYLRRAWQRLRRDWLAMMALGMLVVIVALALAAPLISEHILHADPNRVRLTQKLKPPSAEHRLGTDEYGRDTAARLLHAGRVSLTFAFMVTVIDFAIGVVLGLVAGYFGKRVDDVINAVIQLVNNVPTLFLLIALSVLFRPGVVGLAVLFGVFGWTGIARQVRGRVFTERQRDYVDAARLAGARTPHILFYHLLPNVSSIILVLIGFDIASAILGEAALSYLGFGVQIPTPSWGNMLNNALGYFENAPWLVIAPGVAISLTLFAIYLFNDGLRDALDPRMNN